MTPLLKRWIGEAERVAARATHAFARVRASQRLPPVYRQRQTAGARRQGPDGVLAIPEWDRQSLSLAVELKVQATEGAAVPFSSPRRRIAVAVTDDRATLRTAPRHRHTGEHDYGPRINICLSGKTTFFLLAKLLAAGPTVS